MSYIGRRLEVFSTLDSTNARALELAADPANDGLAILADSQSAGRGQQGRAWLAPPGSSVLLSVLVFPPPALRRPVVLTAWAAVAVCETIQQLTGLPARIKWPNDVLLQGKKVCGILIEQRSMDQRLSTVAGIGLNVHQPREFFEQAGLPLGGSLFERTGMKLDRDLVAQKLLDNLDREYARMLQGEISTLESCWKWHLGLLGQEVKASVHGGESLQGRLRDATFTSLDLWREPGEMVRVPPEKIKALAKVAIISEEPPPR